MENIWVHHVYITGSGFLVLSLSNSKKKKQGTSRFHIKEREREREREREVVAVVDKKNDVKTSIVRAVVGFDGTNTG